MKRAFTLSFLVGIMSFTYLLSAQNIDKRSITGSWLGKIAAGENLAAINKALKSGGNNSV